MASTEPPNEPVQEAVAELPDGSKPANEVLPSSRFWDRIDAWMSWSSDYINPILVKETRQALKSQQFLATFGLLLLCGWLWSIFFIVIFGPGVRLGASGADVFAGYFFILCFPLLVVIPYGAYRSLAAEWEDGTYELMSISTLSARQIVTGKLGSAVLQMIVYLSALAPCLAFTYLLRGLDLPTILYLLFWLCVNSLFATLVALALATITRVRAWQVLVSVVLIAACLANFFTACSFVVEVALYFSFDDPYFWIASAAVLTGVLVYGVMFLLIARARLMFPSENRSTALRVTMLAQFVLFAGWMGWGWKYEETYLPEMAIVFLLIVCIHWYVMGMFMTSEAAELSPRVKRELPQSFLGRVFLTWFNPGSGTGYMFAVTSFLAAAALTVAVQQSAFAWGLRTFNTRRISEITGLLYFSVFACCYLVIYLGLGRLFIRNLRRFFEVNMLAGILLHLGIFAVANLAPLFFQFAVNGEIDGQYTLLQAPAPVWTLVEAVIHPKEQYIDVLLVILPLFAWIVFMFNLTSVAQEVEQQRVVRPSRIEEDDMELNPPPEPAPTSPWG